MNSATDQELGMTDVSVDPSDTSSDFAVHRKWFLFGPRIDLVRRVAAVVFVLTVGQFVFGKFLAPVLHDRTNSMLEEKLASDLLNGVAPVSYPINVGQPLGLIEIPDSDIRSVVIEGTKTGELAQATGHLVGSALPGQPGVAVVMGRSSSYGAEFSNLDQVVVGEEIIATTGQGRHTYEVVDVTFRDTNDLSAFVGERHMLILMTTMSYSWNDSSRLVVRATLTSEVFPAGEKIDHVTSNDELGASGGASARWASLMWLAVAVLASVMWPLVVAFTGRRVAWMMLGPVAVWVALEAWTSMSLFSSTSL